MKNSDQLLEGYLNECRSRGIGESSLNHIEREITEFGFWLKTSRPKIKLDDVNAENISVYLRRRGIFKARSTVAGIMSILRCYGAYLNRQGVWKKNYLRWMPSPKLSVASHVPKSLKRKQIEAMLVGAVNSKERLHQYMWPAIILCLYSLGLRRVELSTINLDDYDVKEKRIRIHNTKSGFDRYMPLPSSVVQSFEQYLAIRLQILKNKNRPSEVAFFVNRNGSRISGLMISMGLQKIAKNVGVEKFSTHQLRHSCATHLLESGANIAQVKMVLGHACVDTTMRYAVVGDPERRKAMSLHPINQLLREES